MNGRLIIENLMKVFICLFSSSKYKPSPHFIIDIPYLFISLLLLMLFAVWLINTSWLLVQLYIIAGLATSNVLVIFSSAIVYAVVFA